LSSALGRLSWPDLDLRWATLVDYDGFLLASYPPEGQFDDPGRRGDGTCWLRRPRAKRSSWEVALHVDGRFGDAAPGRGDQSGECVLAIGMGPMAPLGTAMNAVREIVGAGATSTWRHAATETNTILWRPGDLRPK
jgi:hypothetical protein